MSIAPSDEVPLQPAGSIWSIPTAVSQQKLQPDVMLGNFRITQFLGRGGMGEVWRAHNAVANIDGVIKLLPQELYGNHAEVARLRESFRRVIELPHPNICPVYQFELDAQHGPYLVMKFIDGITLQEYAARYAKHQGRWSARDVVAVLRPVAAALDYAHSKNVIHRDIKPQNILVKPDGTDPQLIDFGLAVEVQKSVARVSRIMHDNGGTLQYMAPEQLRGRPQDGKSDQYALAALAYELLIGQPPFECPMPEVLMRCVLQEPPPGIPGDDNLSAVFQKALAKEGKERYATCTAFLDAVANPPKAPPARPVTAAGVPTARRSPWPAVMAGAAVVAAAWYFWPSSTAPAVQAPPAANPAPTASAPTNNPIPPSAVATPAPAPASAPVVLPTPVAGVLTVDQQNSARSTLKIKVTGLKENVERWRGQLRGLAAP
ncbi:MAG: serine/threonine-protein kinase, partial [Gemmataceae bacterium]